MTRADIFRWIADHPRAWDGYPTTRGDIEDSQVWGERMARFARHGLLLVKVSELGDAEDAIAQCRHDRRSRYAGSVNKAP